MVGTKDPTTLFKSASPLISLRRQMDILHDAKTAEWNGLYPLNWMEATHKNWIKEPSKVKRQEPMLTVFGDPTSVPVNMEYKLRENFDRPVEKQDTHESESKKQIRPKEIIES